MSLTITGTTWGYLGNAASYIPNLNTNNISLSTINGVSVSALSGGASPTNVPAFRAHRNGTNQTLTTSTYTNMVWSTKEFDTYNNFNTANGRFTPTVAGYYLVQLSIACEGFVAGNSGACVASIRKNNVTGIASNVIRAPSGNVTVLASGIVYLNGSTDYVNAIGYSEANPATITGDAAFTHFSGSLIASGNGLISGTGVTALSALTDVNIPAPTLGNVLQYDGTKWQGVSPSSLISGSQVAFSVHRNGVNQTVASGDTVTLDWTTKIFDTSNAFDLATDRFTPTVPGKYLISLNIYCTPSTTYCTSGIQKNGTQIATGHGYGTNQMAPVTAIVDMNGTTDYLIARGTNSGGTVINGNASYTWFQGVLINGTGSGSGGGATTLSGLTDVTLSSPATGQVLTYNGTSWVNSSGVNGDRLTSGTLSVTANSSTAIISLTTNGTTWGYLGSNSSYLPTINTSAISATAVQISSNTAVTCGAGNAGTLRYNNSNTALELCTGTGWQMMGVGIPAGTISAFASTTCPTGWSEYTPARGRFLRGIDNSAGNDLDGTRAPGATQTDAMANHMHRMSMGFDGSNFYGWQNGSENPMYGSETMSNATRTRVGGVKETATGIRLAYTETQTNSSGETRPKNVAVTFCQFNGTSNGWNNPLSGGSTVPGGSTGQIQYNTSGSFDGSAGLTYDNANSRLTTVNISATALTVNGVPITGSASGDRITSGTTSAIATPSGTIEVSGSLNVSGSITVSNSVNFKSNAAAVCSTAELGSLITKNGKFYHCRM